MRKLVNLGLVVAILVVGYLVVRPQIPRWTVGFVMNQLEENQHEAILEQVETTPNKEALLRYILEGLTYEVGDSRKVGSTAYVVLQLNFLDIQELVLENRQQLLTNAIGNLGGLLTDLLSGDVADSAMGEVVTLLEDDTISRPFRSREVEVVLDRQFLWYVPNLEATLPQFEAVLREEIDFNVMDLLQ